MSISIYEFVTKWVHMFPCLQPPLFSLGTLASMVYEGSLSQHFWERPVGYLV